VCVVEEFGTIPVGVDYPGVPFYWM